MRIATKKAITNRTNQNDEELRKYFKANPIVLLKVLDDERLIQSSVNSYANKKTLYFPYHYSAEIQKALFSLSLELTW